MIVIDKGKLKFLLAGRTLTVTVPPRQRPYRPERAYAIGLNHRNTICHAEILSSHVTPDGIQLQIRQITLDQPHLLAARSEYGYTTNPHQAMTDEPEAVTGRDLDQLAAAAAMRYRSTHAEEFAKREARSLANQLREAHARAAKRGVDVTPETTAIREQLEQIRLRTDEAA